MIFPEKPDPLARIVFISIPEDFEHEVDGFKVDPSKLLPVELQGTKPEEELTHLSWEQIAAGLCKVIGYEPGHPDIQYYRTFLISIRPEIETELSLGAVKKANEKEYGLAEEIFLVLKNLFPQNAGHALNLALALENHSNLYTDLKKDKLAESYTGLAFKEYAELLEYSASSSEVQFNAGHFFFKQGNYSRALECFKAYLAKGKDEKRRKLISEIVEKLETQNQKDNLFKEAYDFITMGNEKEGIKRIEEFLAQQPEVWNGWFIKGWAYRRLGEYRKAKDAFEQACSLSAEPNVDLLNELSICEMELDHYKESRKYLENALKKEPENIKIISNLGILAMKAGNLDEAGGFFQTVLDYEPDDELAKKYLEMIEHEIE